MQFGFVEILGKVSILGECENGIISFGKLTSKPKNVTEWHLHSFYR